MSMHNSTRHWSMVALLSLLAALVSACATNPVTGEQDFVLMSVEEERELGARYHQQMLEAHRVYDDEAVQTYVERLGQALAAESHRPELDYEFTVLDDPSVNAFALPGGYIYVTRGIMAYFRSDAELAGVLGHEIGHVTARHAVQRYSAQTATSVIGAILLSQAGAGEAGASLFRTVQMAAIRGYGREQELQADRLGAQYLARIGYDPSAMRDVIDVLADQEAYAADRREGGHGQSYHGIFATHPDNDARFQRVVRAAKKYRAEATRSPDPAEYHALLDGMTFGPSAADGVVIGDRFLHLDLDASLEVPSGWSLSNHPDELVLSAPDDAARVVVRVTGVDSQPEARALMDEWIGEADLQQEEPLASEHYSAYTGITRTQTRMGARRVRRTVVVAQGHAWYFAAAVRDPKAFDRLDPAFRGVAQRLRPLTPREQRKAQPLQLRIVDASTVASYEALAQAVPERVDDPVARLRLLNGDYPDGSLPASGPVKTLRGAPNPPGSA